MRRFTDLLEPSGVWLARHIRRRTVSLDGMPLSIPGCVLVCPARMREHVSKRSMLNTACRSRYGCGSWTIVRFGFARAPFRFRNN